MIYVVLDPSIDARSQLPPQIWNVDDESQNREVDDAYDSGDREYEGKAEDTDIACLWLAACFGDEGGERLTQSRPICASSASHIIFSQRPLRALR